MAITRSFNPAPIQRSELPGGETSILVKLATIALIVAGLYFAAPILVPLALAMLLSFALAPLVRMLRRLSIPNIPSVLVAVVLAFLVILALGWIVIWQGSDLAQRLPTYRYNIETKIDRLVDAPPGGQLFERAADMVRDLRRKIERQEEPAEPTNSAAESAPEPKPLEVEIRQPPLDPTQVVRTVIGPLISPLATAGLVIVFVIFMLLEREELRNRFVRLAGHRDLPRTTQAIDDAARRVARYLLMQLVVNTTYAIPIWLGLWLIGLPNPALWGLLCGLLRFAPYVGPIIAAVLPLALAIAVDPGWTTFLLAAALFVVVELISNNFIEPWLYGGSTGLSPLAVIAAAVFWAWLWGPIGLLLATPLTVCLVVLGRYVPQLAFLDVLFGSEPALAPPELLYQRLLVGDPNEATERAEEYLRSHSLVDYYQDVAIPALALAEQDRADGRLTDEQRAGVADGALILSDNLSEWEGNGQTTDEEKEDEDKEKEEAVEAEAEDIDLSVLQGAQILCAGARGDLDDAAAVMLAQLFEREEATVRLIAHRALQSSGLRELDVGEPAAVVLSYMNSDSLAHARFVVRRLRRRLPQAKIILGFWNFPPEAAARRDPLEATRADSVATSLEEAIRAVAENLSPERPEDADAAQHRAPLRALPNP